MDLENKLMKMLQQLEEQIERATDEEEKLKLIKQWNSTLSKLLQLRRISNARRRPRKKRIELLGSELGDEGLTVSYREVEEDD